MDDPPAAVLPRVDLAEVPAGHDLPLPVVAHELEREQRRVGAERLHGWSEEVIARDRDPPPELSVVADRGLMAVDTGRRKRIDDGDVRRHQVEIAARIALDPPIGGRAFERDQLLQQILRRCRGDGFGASIGVWWIRPHRPVAVTGGGTP